MRGGQEEGDGLAVADDADAGNLEHGGQGYPYFARRSPVVIFSRLATSFRNVAPIIM